MIIQFTVENFKSLLESTTIDFAAGTATKLSGNLLRHGNGERFVKSMAIYGPNASGKTTILDGLYALKRFVRFSSQDQMPTSQIPLLDPFALDRISTKQPTRLSLTLDLDVDRYTLDVSATANRVWNEVLKVQRIVRQPSRKAASKTLIERRWDIDTRKYSTTLHEDIGTELTRSVAIEQTTPNRLMLGKLATMNNEIASRLIEWFHKDLQFYAMHRNPFSEDAVLSEAASQFKENPAFAATVERFLKDADTGIRHLQVTDETRARLVNSESDEVKFTESTQPILLFRHASVDGMVNFFRAEQESSGTLRFVALLATILQPSERRRLVCVDELSASMHPDLVRRLIRIVHSGGYNPLGHQLLFTTHDTHLMDPNEILRRDQITICNKDRFGRSTAVRLDAFQDAARSDANISRQYLQGRFGGLPQFGPTLEDVEVDDEPLEIMP